MLSLAAALLLGAPAPGQDSFSDPNLACRQACRMDGLTGQCHTNFCSTRLFAPGTMVKACCKRGVKEYPCDGTVAILYTKHTRTLLNITLLSHSQQ